jgi:hypothetical protein
MLSTSRSSALLALLLLGACTSMPSGPSVLVLPGTGKNFDEFRTDDMVCRQFAQQQVGGATPGQVASTSGVNSAAVGTVLGAAAGAAINGGRGAGVGAGTGLALGGLAGTGAAESSAYGLQRRYDFGYQQCMYAKGHKVPVSGRLMMQSRASSYPPPPQGTPPQPPGAAPVR